MAAISDSTAVDRAAHQVYTGLRIVFTVAPILFGIDKFFNWMVDWPDYLASWINDIVPGTGQDFMYVVGAIEIAAGVLVATAPWIGGFVVAGWLCGIIVNLLTAEPPEYYDIALRDFGLMMGALALGRLALAFRPAHATEPVGANAAAPDAPAPPHRLTLRPDVPPVAAAA